MNPESALGCVKAFKAHATEKCKLPDTFDSLELGLKCMQNALMHEASQSFAAPVPMPHNPHLHAVNVLDDHPGIAVRVKSAVKFTFADLEDVATAEYDCVRFRRKSSPIVAAASRTPVLPETIARCVAKKKQMACEQLQRECEKAQRNEERASARAVEKERIAALPKEERDAIKARRREEVQEKREAARQAREAASVDTHTSDDANAAAAAAASPAAAAASSTTLSDTRVLDAHCEKPAHARLPGRSTPRSKHVFFESPVPHDRYLRSLEFADVNPALSGALLRGKASDALELIHGPPGTGKSTALLDALTAHLEANPDARALLVSPTNVGTADMYRRCSERGVSCAVSLHPSRRPADMPLLPGHGDFAAAHVVCCTVAGRNNSDLALLPFSAIYIDEAGLITEPTTWGLLRKEVDRLVLAGDPQQLSARVSCEGATLGYGRSLMERLQALGYPTRLLTVQRRMHARIFAFPNAHFFGGRIRTECEKEACATPLKFVHVCKGAEKASGTSFCNCSEALVAKREAECVGDATVITPYLAQVEAFAKLGVVQSLHTVDSYQGREADTVVLSMVRSDRPGFWADPGRLLVALTRARRQLVIVASADGEAWASGPLRALYEHCLRDGVVERLDAPLE